MGQFYVKGEQKVRPGLYNRYTNRTVYDNTGAIDGICAVPIKATSGPMETVNLFTTSDIDRFNTMYGYGGTTEAVRELFKGGALKVYTYRLGTGGEKAKASLNDTADSPVAVIDVEALYPGTQAIFVTIRERLSNNGQKELLVTGGDGGTEILESFVFDTATSNPETSAIVGEAVAGEAIAGGATPSTTEVDNLLSVVEEAGSEYIKLTKKGDGNGEVALASSVELTGGTDPEVVTSDYSNAFNALEPYRFNVITVDTQDDDVRALLVAYVERVFQTGKWCMGVVGNDDNVGLSTRIARAKAINNMLIVYIGGAFADSTGRVEGYRCMDRIAGMIAATPSNESVVHGSIPGAVDTVEDLTNAQYEDAYKNGVVAISKSPDGTTIWLDNGVTTLVKPGSDQDDGWKKIKRVHTRIELMDRMDRRLAPMIGKVNCTDDGISLVLQAAQDILNTMTTEGKLLDGATVFTDPDNPHTTDSVWLIVQVDDPDTLERIYINYQFRFSPDTVTA